MTEVAAPPAAVIVPVVVEEPVVSQPTVEPNGAAVNGNANASETVAQNGSSKGAKKQQKEPEPPKDPREDPVGWVHQQSKVAKHKVNYELLQWAQTNAVEEEAKRQTLPGKTDKVTSTQFLGFLRDGTLLAQLANKLFPGSVETVHEGEEVKTNKENQVSNLQAFVNFAKEKAGLPEEQVFTVADLQEKGKAGYNAVFNTLFRLANKAQEKFNQAEFEVDRIAQEAAALVDPTIVQKVLSYVPLHLFKRNSTSSNEKNGTANNEGEKQENGTEGEKVVVQEQAVVQVESTTQNGSEPAAGVVSN